MLTGSSSPEGGVREGEDAVVLETASRVVPPLQDKPSIKSESTHHHPALILR